MPHTHKRVCGGCLVGLFKGPQRVRLALRRNHAARAVVGRTPGCANVCGEALRCLRTPNTEQQCVCALLRHTRWVTVSCTSVAIPCSADALCIGISCPLRPWFALTSGLCLCTWFARWLRLCLWLALLFRCCACRRSSNSCGGSRGRRVWFCP